MSHAQRTFTTLRRYLEEALTGDEVSTAARSRFNHPNYNHYPLLREAWTYALQSRKAGDLPSKGTLHAQEAHALFEQWSRECFNKWATEHGEVTCTQECNNPNCVTVGGCLGP